MKMFIRNYQLGDSLWFSNLVQERNLQTLASNGKSKGMVCKGRSRRKYQTDIREFVSVSLLEID